MAFGWFRANTWVKKIHARELSRNQPILRFDVILQHDWPIEQCLLHIRVFFGGKTKRPCFDLFIHWLIKQITNSCRNHFSRSYENRSIHTHSFGLLRYFCKLLCLYLLHHSTYMLLRSYFSQTWVSRCFT